MRRDGDDSVCVARNRVAALAADDGSETEWHRPVRLAERPPEHLDRVRTTEVDVRAGVPAEAAAHRHSERSGAVADGFARLRDLDPGVGASRAADGQATVLLAVEVDQDRPVDEGAVETVRALEPDLLG